MKKFFSLFSILSILMGVFLFSSPVSAAIDVTVPELRYSDGFLSGYADKTDSLFCEGSIIKVLPQMFEYGISSVDIGLPVSSLISEPSVVRIFVCSYENERDLNYSEILKYRDITVSSSGGGDALL